MTEQERYMRRAIELAELGCGRTSPNPMVGCVVVKDGRIISEGYHERIGGYHAERNALMRCAEDPSGADLYVTLEPCCHTGRTPPCTDIILEKRIRRVIVGAGDPNPLVAGKGLQILRDAGVEVKTGILEEECLRQNEVFFHYIRGKMPFVVMKTAMTLDGKIACSGGDSCWVTGEAARKEVHALRNRYQGILAGIGTVLADDPLLTCRIPDGKNPVRIICDSALRIPLDSKLVQTAREVPLIVACTEDAAREPGKAEALRQAGAEVIATPGARVNLPELMRELGAREIDGILLEGGGTLNAAMLEAGLVQKAVVYLAPKMVGGENAPTPVRGAGLRRMAEAWKLENVETAFVGEDIRVTGYLRKES